MTKPNQIIGYIITTEYWHEPLELIAGPPYPWPVLLRGDNVTLFETRRAAALAIKKTLEWARRLEGENEELRPLKWAEEDQHKIWPVRRQ